MDTKLNVDDVMYGEKKRDGCQNNKEVGGM